MQPVEGGSTRNAGKRIELDLALLADIFRGMQIETTHCLLCCSYNEYSAYVALPLVDDVNCTRSG